MFSPRSVCGRGVLPLPLKTPFAFSFSLIDTEQRTTFQSAGKARVQHTIADSRSGAVGESESNRQKEPQLSQKVAAREEVRRLKRPCSFVAFSGGRRRPSQAQPRKPAR